MAATIGLRMATPLHLASLSPRSPAQIAAVAQATQANLAALKVAWQRSGGGDAINDDIRTPSPGPVSSAREILIDRNVIKSYSSDEVLIRLRQVWGEFCALCWLFPHVDPQKPISFEPLPANQTTRCPGETLKKLDEVQRHFWRIRHEQRLRFDTGARRDPAFQRDDEIAAAMRLRVYGQVIQHCPDEVLLAAACEYAGMLAALRWSIDDRWEWEGPGIMDLALNPVTPLTGECCV